MRYPDIPAADRLDAAHLAGAVKRLAWGKDSHLPLERKLAELWSISRDPRLLGHVMGPYLAEEPPTAGGRAARELLRAAGADEAEAQGNAAWQRYQVEQRLLGRYADDEP